MYALVMRYILAGDRKANYKSYANQDNDTVKIVSSIATTQVQKTKNNFIVGLQLDTISSQIYTSTTSLLIPTERCPRKSTSIRFLNQLLSLGFRKEKSLCWKRMGIQVMVLASRILCEPRTLNIGLSHSLIAPHLQTLHPLRTAGSQSKHICANIHIGAMMLQRI